MMHKVTFWGGLCALAISAGISRADTQLDVVRITTGVLNRPVSFVAAPGDFGRAFIADEFEGTAGAIRVLDLRTGDVAPTPFLSIDPVGLLPEQGMLGLAFHPAYAENGFFYVYYVAPSYDIHLVRYQVSSDPNVADPNSAYPILTIPHPTYNFHNGGWLAFGADGYLYVSVGDGGGRYDPNDNAQNLGLLVGKILRIDVNGDDFPDDPERNYAIPLSNPFINTPGATPEIWAYGLRNPWRCSFDRETNDLYVADVGQETWEEIDFEPAGSAGGLNFGWRCMEGPACTGFDGCDCNSPALTLPIYAYNHNGQSAAVIGGYVYRGVQMCDLRGTYFLADYSRVQFWSFRYDGVNLTDFRDRTTELSANGEVANPTAFGQDAAGELYFTCSIGDVWKIVGVGLPVRGDMNHDGVLNFDDINAFVQGLTDPAGYETQYGVPPTQTGDLNCDGMFNFDDINPFVALLAGS